MAKIDTFYEDLERRKRDLHWACRSRIVTSDEMDEIEKYGVDLIIQFNVPFNRGEKEREFNDLLLQQFRLRCEADKVKQANL